MSKTYRASLIGVGKPARIGDEKDGCKIGYIHAEMLTHSPRIKLVSGVDLKQENLTVWQEKYGIGRGFLSLEQMLEEDRPDVVGIATYVGSHYPIIEKVARAGVSGILCEKPFLNSPTEWGKLRPLIAETGVNIVVNHMRRHQPLFQEIRRRLSAGAIGRPELMNAGVAGWDLSEWGAHWLDLFRFFNNDAPLSWAFGQTRTRALRSFGHCMEEHACGYFAFANGCRGLVDGGQALGSATMNIQGSDGMIRVHNEGKAEIITAQGSELLETDSYGTAVWLAPWHGLLDWMEGAKEPDLGATNQLLTSELNFGLYLSALHGDRVDFPIVGELTELTEWPVDAIARKNAHVA